MHMAKDFETKVLKALNTLQKGQQQLEQGQKELVGNVSNLEQGQKQLQASVSRLEVLHEETAGKIDTIIEVVGSQHETMQKLATKDDIAEVRTDIAVIKRAVKATNQDLKSKNRFPRLKTA